MKTRTLFLAASLLAVAACSSSPTGPSALPTDPIPGPSYEDTLVPPLPGARYEDTPAPPKP